MAIRFGNTCANCASLDANNICDQHKIVVDKIYTCDRFTMKSTLKDARSCNSCLRYNESDCANPEKASLGMLCSHWAPQQASV